MKHFLPLLLAVAGGVLYHIGQKAVPRQVHPFVAILLAYLGGIACCVVALVLAPPERPWLESLRAANWAVWLLGLGAVIIEIGFLLAYRAGWQISVVSVVVNISVALVLLPIGLVFFRESLSWRMAAGVVCCLVGLYLLSQK
jgi:drug/metabolite transporter (DMT)-like permease